ncbi:hypothetical protein CMO96_04820 [Candidatus Woesebacteria bacterium]|nr:hypothetical protein [Candidatus Woesebacteria bacterium]|tara:strand:+ start:1194 stop:1781 length:588 start_codon:yes stop_codon:yes gene_type:complete
MENREIVLESPENLEPGQNFFDQPPFELAVKKATEQTGIDAIKLKGFLWYFATQFGESPQPRPPATFRLLKSLPSNVTIPDREKYGTATEIMIAALDPYPHWAEYAVTQFDHGNYKSSGEPSRAQQKRKKLVLPETYAKWVTHKTRAEHRAVLLGIEDVFPGQLGREPELVPQTGKNRQARRWRILKASELTKRR